MAEEEKKCRDDLRAMFREFVCSRYKYKWFDETKVKVQVSATTADRKCTYFHETVWLRFDKTEEERSYCPVDQEESSYVCDTLEVEIEGSQHFYGQRCKRRLLPLTREP